jgi:cytochrome c553
MAASSLQPDWLFPVPADAGRPAAPVDDVTLLGIPGSDEHYTQARINNAFWPPDWHPTQHIAMPEVVAHGRKPDVTACGYCHTPTGQGRPENSALAGLPAAYIEEQLRDFRSGARQPSAPMSYGPSQSMHKLSAYLTDAEIKESAHYFAQQKLGPRVQVQQAPRIPRAVRSHWIYIVGAGEEELGDRLIEFAPDIERHERRDDRMVYTAYAPPGSVARGRRLAMNSGILLRCATCHGGNLQGTDKVPPIAGRSPTYLLRQLLAFKTGVRANANAQQMLPVVEHLEINDMIAVAAYLATLPP